MSAGGTGGALKQGSAACGGGLFSPATPLGATIWPVGWSTTSRSFGAFATWARRSALRPPIFHLGLMHSRVLFCARKRGQGPRGRLFHRWSKNTTPIKRACPYKRKALKHSEGGGGRRFQNYTMGRYYLGVLLGFVLTRGKGIPKLDPDPDLIQGSRGSRSREPGSRVLR